ncbi:MAG: hypothetical protein L6Q76_31255 [Polyangiaceae bacterium]|nr:hypothetical protein [Polyangiaceae bacterium]
MNDVKFKKEKTRKLTPGEKLLVVQVYKNSVNADLVNVHNRKYIFFQPNGTLMTPNGSIYAGKAYKDDYSAHSLDDASLFIHEIAHVWQKQNKVLNPFWAGIGQFLRNPFNYDGAYDYTLDAEKDLLDYKIEQQAQIIQDYFQIFIQKRGPWSDNMKNDVSNAERNKLYEAVLARFITNPKYPTLKDAAKGTSGLIEGYSGGGFGGGGASGW